MPTVSYFFDYNPDVSAESSPGSYTVPAGKYAFVNAYVDSAQNMTIGGAIMGHETSHNNYWWLDEGTTVSKTGATLYVCRVEFNKP